MPSPNRAVVELHKKNQRSGGPVCNGAPFNVVKRSNDVEIENVGLTGFLKPMVVSKKTSQRAPTGTAVAFEHLPVVVPAARFTSKIMAGVDNATKKFKKSPCAGSGARSFRLGGNSSSALGANEPRDHDDVSKERSANDDSFSPNARGGALAPVLGELIFRPRRSRIKHQRSNPRFSTFVVVFFLMLLFLVDTVEAVFTPSGTDGERTNALLDAIGSNGDGCLTETPDGSCPNFANRDVPIGHGSGKYGAIGTWDVSGVTDMQGLFSDQPGFNADISNWDTGFAINMARSTCKHVYLFVCLPF